MASGTAPRTDATADPHGSTADDRRAEAAHAFAACVAMGDWSNARRIGLDFGSGIGQPPGSCGMHKHEAAKLYYEVDGEVVRVRISAFSYIGRFAMTLPLSCDRPDGEHETIPVSEWEAQREQHRGACSHLPWPMVWDYGAICPSAIH